MSELSIINFAVAFIGTIFLAKILEAVIMIWLSEESARLSSFSFLLGTAFAAKSVSVGAIIGAILGYAVVWWLFFRRETANG